MLKYSNIIVLFFNVICNNAFMLTPVNKIFFVNTRNINIRKINILMNNKVNNSNNMTNAAFPSFYDFLRERPTDEDNVETIKADFYNFKANIKEDSKDSNIGNSFAMNLNSKNLKLLTSFSAIHWARTWIYDMVYINENFPAFMYQDMYKLCDFGSVNVSKLYFYIGYYPPKIDQSKGPYYIGAFEVIPTQREFITHIIIQNPHHCVENNYTKEDINDFKKELQALCVEATVFFKFSNLKNTSFERYYYSWLYEA